MLLVMSDASMHKVTNNIQANGGNLPYRKKKEEIQKTHKSYHYNCVNIDLDLMQNMRLNKWYGLMRSVSGNSKLNRRWSVRRSVLDSIRYQSSNANSIQNLFDAVETCDVGKVEKNLKEEPNVVNRRNPQGLTGLMVSSVLGYGGVVELLLKHNCDITLRSPSGHTGLELAAFYRNRDAYSLLHTASESPPKFDIFFGDNPLNRQSDKRSMKETITEYMESEQSSFILFHKDRWPLVTRSCTRSSRPGGRPKPNLLHVNFHTLKKFIDEATIINTSVFLGVLDGKDDGFECPFFAVDISHLEGNTFKELHPDADALADRRGVFTLSPEEAAIVGQGRCMLDWNDRFRFCSSCGSETVSRHAGYKRECVNEGCISNSGVYNTSYPRVDPSIISLITSPDQSSLLLARSQRYIDSMYSCLAGYVEPGETIENAVKREVHEEVGVNVTNIHYVASQPWPMPSVLMLGCTACATGTELNIDTKEIEFAQWFSREDIVGMITRTHPDGLFTPPRQAIAHQLIKQWLIQTAF